MWETILITALGLVGDLMKDGADRDEPMTPEVEAAWNKVIAAKEEAMDAAAARAKKRAGG